jgi:hypothetical protein
MAAWLIKNSTTGSNLAAGENGREEYYIYGSFTLESIFT